MIATISSCTFDRGDREGIAKKYDYANTTDSKVMKLALRIRRSIHWMAWTYIIASQNIENNVLR